MDDRRRSIEELIKSLKQGGEGRLGANWEDDTSFNKRVLQARDLSEEALAHEVMRKTGVPIPSNNASLLRKEDFYNRVLEEVYPEFDADLTFNPEVGKGTLGTYDPNNGKIELNPKVAQQDLRKGLATSLHEAGHKYDDKVLKYNMPKNLITGKNAESQLDLDKALNRFLDSDSLPDPSSLYDVAAKGHHARIPNLREGNSFGLGALKSYLKSGTFKALPLVGPALAGAAALSSQDASAAIPVLNEAESLGPEKGSDDYEIENPQGNPQLRQQALQRLLKR